MSIWTVVILVCSTNNVCLERRKCILDVNEWIASKNVNEILNFSDGVLFIQLILVNKQLPSSADEIPTKHAKVGSY